MRGNEQEESDDFRRRAYTNSKSLSALVQAPMTTLAILGVILMGLLVNNSSERLEDEFEKFIDYAICVAQNGNTKSRHNRERVALSLKME